jgi:hypothetical protein
MGVAVALALVAVVVLTSLWVLVDAPHRGLSWTWALGCLLLWIVVFPWYLHQRSLPPHLRSREPIGLVVFGAVALLAVVVTAIYAAATGHDVQARDGLLLIGLLLAVGLVGATVETLVRR